MAARPDRRWARNIRRKFAGDLAPEGFATVLERAERIRRQHPGDTNKLLALHTPKVECIGNRRDGHRLGVLIDQVVRLTGRAVRRGTA